jgi:hypothetical protein
MRGSAGRLLAGAGKHTAVPHYRAAVHVAAIARVHRKNCATGMGRHGSSRQTRGCRSRCRWLCRRRAPAGHWSALLCAADGWGRADRGPRAPGSAWLRCWAARACCCAFGLRARAPRQAGPNGVKSAQVVFLCLDDLFCFEKCTNFVKL